MYLRPTFHICVSNYLFPCFASHLGYRYMLHIHIPNEENTRRKKKHWQMAEVKAACCSLEAALLAGLDRGHP